MWLESLKKQFGNHFPEVEFSKEVTEKFLFGRPETSNQGFGTCDRRYPITYRGNENFAPQLVMIHFDNEGRKVYRPLILEGMPVLKPGEPGLLIINWKAGILPLHRITAKIRICLINEAE